MINKWRHETQKLEKELERFKTDFKYLVKSIDWYIIYHSIDNDVCKKRKKILLKQEKKLKK